LDANHCSGIDERRRIRLPEKDVPILVGAIEARATHLISGDLQHFGLYSGNRIEGILIGFALGLFEAAKVRAHLRAFGLYRRLIQDYVVL
jgi:hypothetical protein